MGEQEETTKLRAQHLLMMRQEEERTAAAAKLLAHPGLNVAAAPRSENSQMAVRVCAAAENRHSCTRARCHLPTPSTGSVHHLPCA